MFGQWHLISFQWQIFVSFKGLCRLEARERLMHFRGVLGFGVDKHIWRGLEDGKMVIPNPLLVLLELPAGYVVMCGD